MKFKSNLIGKQILLFLALPTILSACLFNNLFFFGLSLIFLVILIFDRYALLSLYFFFGLGNNFLSFANGLSPARLLGLAIIISSLYYARKHKIKFNPSHFMLVLLVLLLSVLKSFIGAEDPSLIPLLVFIQNMFILVMITSWKSFNIKRFNQSLFVGAGLLVLMFIIYYYVTFRGKISVSRFIVGDHTSANRLGTMLEQISLIVLIAIFNYRNVFWKLLFTLLLFAGVLLLLFTGTRAALIAFLLTVPYILYKSINVRWIFMGVLLLFSGLYLSNIKSLEFFAEISSLTSERFVAADFEKDGAGVRVRNWSTLIPVVIKNRPITGYGFGGLSAQSFAQRYGRDYAAHNLVFDIFYQMGLIGLLVFGLYYFYVWKRSSVLLSDRLFFIPGALFIAMIINGMGETVFTEKAFMCIIAMCIMYTNNRYDIINEKNN